MIRVYIWIFFLNSTIKLARKSLCGKNSAWQCLKLHYIYTIIFHSSVAFLPFASNNKHIIKEIRVFYLIFWGKTSGSFPDIVHLLWLIFQMDCQNMLFAEVAIVSIWANESVCKRNCHIPKNTNFFLNCLCFFFHLPFSMLCLSLFNSFFSFYPKVMGNMVKETGKYVRNHSDKLFST